MKLSYLDIKAQFLKYLTSKKDIDIDSTNPDSINIFAYNDEFHDFLFSKFGSNKAFNTLTSISLKDLQSLSYVDGKFTINEILEEKSDDKTEDTDNADETDESESVDDTDNVEEEEIDDKTKSEDEELSDEDVADEELSDEEVSDEELSDEEYILSNSFILDYINDFINNEDVKNIIDTDSDGESGIDEVNSFLTNIANKDESSDDVSFFDIQNTSKKIQESTFNKKELEETIDTDTIQETKIEETAQTVDTNTKEDTIQDISSNDSQSTETASSPESTESAGGAGGSGYTGGTGGTDHSGTKIKNSQNISPEENNYSSMSLEALKSKQTEKRAEMSNVENALSAIFSGENKVVQNAQTVCDEKKASYEEFLKKDEQISAELKEQIAQNTKAIEAKEDKISTTVQNIVKNDSAVYAKKNEIEDIDSTLDALNTSKINLNTRKTTQNATLETLKAQEASLQNQESTDSETKSKNNEELTKIQGQIAKIEAELKEIDNKLNDIEQKESKCNEQKKEKEAELAELEKEGEELSISYEQQQKDLEELQNQKNTLDEQILKSASPETQAALQEYNTAKSNIEIAKGNEYKIAINNLQTIRTDLNNLNTAIREKEAQQTQKENKVGQADLFTDTGFEIWPSVERDGMNYFVVAPKGADPNEELPVVVYLHGGGEKGNDLEKIKKVGLVDMMINYSNEFGQTPNVYFLIPQTPDNWIGKEEDLRKIVNEFGETHAIDTDNIAIAGHSMGGIGALYTAGTNDDHFFSRALVLSGFNPGDKYLKNINIPVYGVGERGNYTKDLIANVKDSKYVDTTASHAGVPRFAFGLDENNNGCSDVIEWLFPDYVN